MHDITKIKTLAEVTIELEYNVFSEVYDTKFWNDYVGRRISDAIRLEFVKYTSSVQLKNHNIEILQGSAKRERIS